MNQIKKLLQIAWLYLYTTYKDRSTLIWGLALPLIFTTVLGVGMQGFASSDEPPTWELAVINQDAGEGGGQLIAALDTHPSLRAYSASADEAARRLADGEIAATLSLPAALSENLLAGQHTQLLFQTNVSEPRAAQVVEQAVLAALYDLSASVGIANTSLNVAERLDLFALDGAPTQDEYLQEGLAAARQAQEDQPIGLQTRAVSRLEEQDEVPIGFSQASPGNMVIFSMFFIVYGASSILLEREQGTLRRLLTMPVSKLAILGGKLLGVFVAGVAQISLLVIVGQLAFNVPWGQSPAALAAMIVAFAFCITSMGMLLAALVRTYAQIDAMSMMLILPLAGLGGAMWPIEIVPDFMQKIATYLPTGWAMRGFQDIIISGFGLAEVLPAVGVLVLFGIVFLALGVWRFRYE
ncbi:MAG: ABC transporter permease [Anaerolineales bacterium]|nr:MAG: ABC transporter permease [Anaerolineales bacterium]